MPRTRFGRKIMPECVLGIFDDPQRVLAIFFMKNIQNVLWASSTDSLFARTHCGQFETEKNPQRVLATILNTPNAQNSFCIFRVTPTY